MGPGPRSVAGGSIRDATPDDAPAIAALIASYADDLVIDPAQAAPYLASVSEAAERGYLASPRYRYLVAEAGGGAGAGALAGFIAMRDATHLFHLFVARDRQRRGLARALWSRVLEGAPADSAARGWTVNSSLAAVPVYRSFGFVETGPVTRVHGIAFVPMARPGMPTA